MRRFRDRRDELRERRLDKAFEEKYGVPRTSINVLHMIIKQIDPELKESQEIYRRATEYRGL